MSLLALDPETALPLLALWMFVLGGVFGSFLNVVVYRLPAGMSLSRPCSHCPLCKHPIRWYDNVPVLGWIFLRGRCRDCRAPISIRYPLVETVTGGLFLVLGLREVIGHGVNLPAGGQYDTWQLCGIYVFHLLLLYTLLAAALIQYDGKQPPARLFAIAVVVGLLTPPFWPTLHPLAVRSTLAGPMDEMVAGLVGLAAGAVLGRLLGGRRGDGGLTWGFACAGLFLGWQAACALAIWTAVIGLPLQAVARRRQWPVVPLSAWLLLGALAWILCWARIVDAIK